MKIPIRIGTARRLGLRQPLASVVIGVITSTREDANGLYIEGRILTEWQKALTRLAYR